MTVAPLAAVDAPYRGLAPFGDSDVDALLFFGRERETEIAVANLIGSRLTVLYGPSGVGKSSMLRAGVARRIRELGARRAVGRGPDVAVVVFSSWSDDPRRDVAAAVRAEIAPLVSPLAPLPPADASLADVVEHWSALLDGDVCLVLDQFEEYFVYHEDDDGPGTLVGELPEVVSRQGLRANVMLSVRDDSLSRLDVLKARIPHLYANTLRLDRLDRDAARAAILGPVERWNDHAAHDERVDVEPELVDAVLVQSRVAGDADRIEAPYLQLVMERIWEEERGRGSDVLRLATLVELGGAAAIVRDHLDRALDVLDDDEQEAAARMFDHLVTPSGTKIAHRATDLAQFAHLGTAAAAPVLAALGRERILRPLDETAGDGDRYEIFHDVLAAAILEWRRRREVEHERVVSKRRQRRLGAGLVAALVLVVAMAGLTAYALTQRSEAQQQAEAARDAQETAEQSAREEQKSNVAAQRSASKARAAEKKKDTALKQSERDRKVAVQKTNVANAALADSEQSRKVAEQKTEEANQSAAALRVANDRLEDSNNALEQSNARLAEKTRAAQKATAAKEVANKRLRGSQRREHASAVESRAQALASQALAKVGDDPEASLRLALASLKTKPTPLVERVLRDGLLATHGRFVLRASGAATGGTATRQGARAAATAPESGAVNAAAISRDGALVATATASGVVRVFRTRNGSVVRTVEAGSLLRGIAFNGDGSQVAAGGRDGRTRVWDVRTGALLHDLRSGGPVRSVTYSPDGSLLATASNDQTVKLWSAASGTLLKTLRHPRSVLSATFSGDGAFLATVADDQFVRVYEVRSDRREPRYSFDNVREATTAAFSPDATSIATASRDGNVRLWSLIDGGGPTILPARGNVLALAFAPNGERLAASGTDPVIRIWNVATHELESTPTGHTASVRALSYSADGSLLLSAGDDRAAIVWRADGDRLAQLLGHSAGITFASFAPTGFGIVTASKDGTGRTWDGIGEPQLRLLGRHDGRVTGVATAGTTVASSGVDERVRLWDLRRRTATRTLAADVPLNGVAVSRDGAVVAAAGADGGARVWRGGDVTVLRGGSGALRGVSLTPDGRLVAAGGADGIARVWRTTGGAPVATLGHARAVNAVALSPDGRRLATAGADGIARIWSLVTRRPLLLEGHEAAVLGVAFSADGKRVITSSQDKDALIWDATTGRVLRTLRGHAALVSGAALSADGRWALTAGPSKAGIWPARDRELGVDRLTFLGGHAGVLTAAAWIEHVAVTGGADGTVRTYECMLCGSLDELVPLARARLATLDRGRR
jgi:WD40 repeat protein